MLIEQAVFTSALTRHARGYHLVARSPGVSDGLAQALAVWGPTHDALFDSEATADSLSYFPLDHDWAALSRTVYGESEYSDRGGLRLETNMLVIRQDQLAGYDHNCLYLAKTALAFGHLRLRASTPTHLDAIELPQWPVVPNNLESAASHTADPELIARIVQEIGQRRVMVVGAEHPQAVVEAMFDHLGEHERAMLSFTTGLKPSLHRPFQLQFLSQADNTLRDQFAATGVVCIDAHSVTAMST